MSMSNIEYSALKKKSGLHNRGFIPAKEEFDEFGVNVNELDVIDMNTPLEDTSSEVVQQNSFGEYYALQDYEE